MTVLIRRLCRCWRTQRAGWHLQHFRVAMTRLSRRIADAGGLDIGGDDAVADVDDAMGELGDVGFVGDDDDGVAAMVELVEERHDLVAGLGVEVAGGLVGEDDRGAIDERAGDGDALALSAGELVGLVAHAAVEVDGVQRGGGAFDAFGGRGAVVDQRELDVVQRRGAGEQVEGLKDEADLAVADAGEFVVVEVARPGGY